MSSRCMAPARYSCTLHVACALVGWHSFSPLHVPWSDGQSVSLLLVPDCSPPAPAPWLVVVVVVVLVPQRWMVANQLRGVQGVAIMKNGNIITSDFKNNILVRPCCANPM